MPELEAGKVYLDADGDRWIATAEPERPGESDAFFWCPTRGAFIGTAAYMALSGAKFGPFTLAADQPLPRTLEEHAAAIQAAIKAAADDGFWLDDGDGGTPDLDLNHYRASAPMLWVNITVPER